MRSEIGRQKTNKQLGQDRQIPRKQMGKDRLRHAESQVDRERRPGMEERRADPASSTGVISRDRRGWQGGGRPQDSLPYRLPHQLPSDRATAAHKLPGVCARPHHFHKPHHYFPSPPHDAVCPSKLLRSLSTDINRE